MNIAPKDDENGEDDNENLRDMYMNIELKGDKNWTPFGEDDNGNHICPKDDKYCTLSGEKEVDTFSDGTFSDVCTNNNEELWEDGVVPFVFDTKLTPELSNSLNKAMDDISCVSSIKFVQKTDQRDFITFIDGKKFSSPVGKKGGEQLLKVTDNPNKWPHLVGSSKHELLHALGFHHEHSRPDRDTYVTVKGTSKNHKKLEESKVQSFGPYDPDSITHYSNKQGVKLRSGISAKIGQRENLSDGDIFALNMLYPPEKIIISRLAKILEKRSNKCEDLRTYLMTKLPAHRIMMCMLLMENDFEQGPTKFRVMKDNILEDIDRRFGRSPHLQSELNKIFEKTREQLVQNNTKFRKRMLGVLKMTESKIMGWIGKTNDSSSPNDFKMMKDVIQELEKMFDLLFQDIQHEEDQKSKELSKMCNEALTKSMKLADYVKIIYHSLELAYKIALETYRTM